MRRGKSADKFLRRAAPHGTLDSGAVLHRCAGVEGCGECPQAVEGVGSHRRTLDALTRPPLVVSPAAAAGNVRTFKCGTGGRGCAPLLLRETAHGRRRARRGGCGARRAPRSVSAGMGHARCSLACSAARQPRDCGRGHFVLGSQAGTPPTEAATKQRAEAQRLGAFSRTVRCVARGISFNSTVSQCQFAF